MSPENSKQETQTSAHITAHSLLMPTIQAWRYFLEDQGASPHTIKAFMADLRLLAAYLPPDRPLGEVTTTTSTTSWIGCKTGAGVPCSPKTLARRITSLKAFFRWLHHNGVAADRPGRKGAAEVSDQPAAGGAHRPRKQDVLDVAEAYRQRSQTGCPLLRPAGAAAGIPASRRASAWRSPQPYRLAAPDGPIAVCALCQPAEPLQRTQDRSAGELGGGLPGIQAQYQPRNRLSPGRQRRLEYLLEDLGEEAGLKKHLSFDMCRWTCALNDWRAGMDREKIRQKLGISKIQWREIKHEAGERWPLV